MGITELTYVLTDNGDILAGLFIFVAVSAILLAAFAGLVRSPIVLMFELVFDMCWVGGVVYICGGILGPAAPIMYAIVIIGTLLLPGFVPFLLSSVGAGVLIIISALYIVNWAPFEDLSAVTTRDIGNTELIISTVSVQVIAIFLIDVLGQVLARRTRDQQLVVGDLLDQIGDGIILVDQSGFIRHMNEQALALLAISGDSIGLSARTLFEPERYTELRELLLLSSGLKSEHIQLDNRFILAMANDVRGRRGRLYGRMVSLRDETAVRQLEDNVRRAEHLASLGEMAAGIAHEIRNPLTSLRGCSQEIHGLSKERDLKDFEKLSKIVINEADRLGNIVNDVLGFARQHSLYLQPLEMKPYLNEICDEYRQRLELPSQISLQVSVSDDCPAVTSDAEKLKQILHNLIDNATHAFDDVAVPVITLVAEKASSNILDSANQAVALRVQDNGMGIEEHMLSQVFTPFYSTRSQGTGLGLALVQRLVRALGGLVRIDSKKDVGTTVTVLLPAVENNTQL